MKIIVNFTLLLLLASLISGCSEEFEITPRDYPRINTLSVTEITPKGAKFNAKIFYRGEEEILNYGFVWRTFRDPTIQNEKRVVSANIQVDTFSQLIESTLSLGGTYYVRAFVETKDYLVYGESVKFSSQGSQVPKLFSFAPTSAMSGDTIVIQGKGFSNVVGNSGFTGGNVVTFGGVPSRVISANDSLLKVIVPFELDEALAAISVSVAGYPVKSANNFKLFGPTITGFSKEEITYCDSLVIRGTDFPPNKRIIVNFLDQTVEGRFISENELIVPMPQFLKDSGPIVPVVAFGNFIPEIKQSILFKAPEIKFSVDSFLSYLDTFSVQYQNLGDCNPTIRIQGAIPKIISRGINEVEVQVPFGTPIFSDQKVEIRVLLREEELIKQDFYRRVENYRVVPSSAKLGDIVRLEGKGYNPERLRNRMALLTQKDCVTNTCRVQCDIVQVNDRHISFRLPTDIDDLINSDGKVYLSFSDIHVTTPLIEYKIDL